MQSPAIKLKKKPDELLQWSSRQWFECTGVWSDTHRRVYSQGISSSFSRLPCSGTVAGVCRLSLSLSLSLSVARSPPPFILILIPLSARYKALSCVQPVATHAPLAPRTL